MFQCRHLLGIKAASHGFRRGNYSTNVSVISTYIFWLDLRWSFQAFTLSGLDSPVNLSWASSSNFDKPPDLYGHMAAKFNKREGKLQV